MRERKLVAVSKNQFLLNNERTENFPISSRLELDCFGVQALQTFMEFSASLTNTDDSKLMIKQKSIGQTDIIQLFKMRSKPVKDAEAL